MGNLFVANLATFEEKTATEAHHENSMMALPISPATRQQTMQMPCWMQQSLRAACGGENLIRDTRDLPYIYKGETTSTKKRRLKFLVAALMRFLVTKPAKRNPLWLW